MKKFLLFLLVLFIMPVFAGAFDFAPSKEFLAEQDKLTTELNNLQQNSCDLYGLIENELSSYYGKKGIKSFYDPEHKTGWFRVYDFLTWLKTNEKELTEKLAKEADAYNYSQYNKHLKNPLAQYCSLRTRKLKGFLGVFLGKEYLLSKYSQGQSSEQEYIKIEKTKETAGHIEEEDVSIAYNKKAFVSFTDFVNVGIHESMHLMGIMTTNSKEVLLEIFTTYAQMAYALPVKIDEPNSFVAGARNLYNTVKFYPKDAVREYNHTFFAYIQFKGLSLLSKEEIVDFSKQVKKMNTGDNQPYESATYSLMYGRNFFDDLLIQKQYKRGYKTTEQLEEVLLSSGNLDDMLLEIKGPFVFIYKNEEDKKEGVYLFRIESESIEKHMQDFALLPEYEQTFEDIASEYIKIAMDSLKKEHDLKKYLDIRLNPLKYILKENKDIPPTPEGYI